jgi:predicted Zn-dependent protease with MMP-like domain
MTREELIRLASDVVTATQKRLPGTIQPLAQAVPVHLEEWPSEELVADGIEDDVLGLFSGEPHGEAPSDNPLPAQILLFLGNIWEYSEGDPGVFRDEVRLTYLHELGHYLGWDEDEVAHRGLD